MVWWWCRKPVTCFGGHRKMTGKENMKYITYRGNREIYQIKINIRLGDIKKQVVKQAKTLDEAILIRKELLQIYKMTDKLQEDKPQQTEPPIVKKSAEQTVKKEPTINIEENNFPTLKKGMLLWYEQERKPFTEIQTQIKNEAMMTNHIFPTLGHLKVNEITKADIKSLVLKMQSVGGNRRNRKSLSARYTKSTIGQIKLYFDYLIDNGVIEKNPCSNIKCKPTIPKQKDVFNEMEKQRFLKYVKSKSYDYYLLFKIYFESCSRRSELIGLPWRNIDFKKSGILIQQTIVKARKGKYEVKQYPKNKNIHFVYLSDKTMFSLRMKYESVKRKDNFDLNDFVFQQENKQHLFPDTITKSFKSYVDELNIKGNITLHSTRHTTAAELIMKGALVPVVQAIGGWKNPDTLMKIYTHVQTENIKEAQEKLFSTHI